MAESAPPRHVCYYQARLVWSEWAAAGEFVERIGRRLPTCPVCGRERTAQYPRPPMRRELRAAVAAAPPLSDPAGRAVADALLRRDPGTGEPILLRGLLGDLSRHGLPASLSEEWIERFLRAGWLATIWKMAAGSPRFVLEVKVLDREALRELSRPGDDARRQGALLQARARTALLAHPKAREIAALLEGGDAERFPPVLVEALASLAELAESGDTFAERVFSARHLGHSKALGALRGRIERQIGPLAEIGIREGASTTLLGGMGTLRLSTGVFDLRSFPPFLGLARETVESLEGIDPPAAGLFVVENLAAFEACCRGEVAGARGCLVIWSAGYPGRAVRRLVERARGVPVRVWADLDLDGVRIARLVSSWAPEKAAAYRMAPGDVRLAAVRRPLSPRSVLALRRELDERPEEPLADTLRALLDAGFWVEQEAFLGNCVQGGERRRPLLPGEV